MKKNMNAWINEQLDAKIKTPMPVLSFPAAPLLGINVRELIFSAENQANCMKTVANRVPTSAAMSLMDLSVEAEAFGAKIRVTDDEIPTVPNPLVTDAESIAALKIPEVGAGRTGLCVEAVKKASAEISDVPVFAGMIGPYSLSGRLVGVSDAMIFCYDEPEAMAELLDKASDFLISYAKAFKAAGANGIIMAEPLTGLLSPSLAEEFSEPYVKKIIDSVQDDSFAVIYHNCGNNVILMIDSILRVGAAGYHFGNAIKMSDMLPHIPENVLVMGNIDPAGQFKNGTPESIREETLKLLGECSKYKNFVISSGCDIPPLTPWENIDAFFAAVSEFYKA